MTIGIDIRALASGRRSGVEEYTEQVVSRMIRQAPEHQFKLFFSSFKNNPPDFDWLKLPNVKLYQRRIPNRLLFLLARLFNWPKLDQLMGGADVFFSPHFFLAPLSSLCRRVTTFHDLSFERFPEFFTFGQRLWHQFMSPARQSRLSERVIAVSHSTKNDLVQFYGLDPVNVSVVHNASSVVRPNQDELEDFKQKNNLPERYIFSLGTLEPRKNTAGIVRAFNQLRSKPGFEDVQLLIGGGEGWKCQDVFSEIENSPFKKDIWYLGPIGNERAHYYSLASVFVYPSFFEGFGIPVLEAMSCGTPVVTSANSSMPEVAGPASLLVDPYNISAIATAMASILSSGHLAEELRTRSRAQSERFSWDKAAVETLAVITHS